MSNYGMLKNSEVFFQGPFMHEARKTFKTIREALESVYDLFENAIVADHFMTFYAEACDDYDYSIDNIFDSI